MRLVSHPTAAALAAAASPGPDGQTHAVSVVLGQMADRIAASLLRS
jgi:hypothetical protein